MTKNKPGVFDCYAKAGPDEEMFVLLGRDAAAPAAIRAWVVNRVMMGKNQPGDSQLIEALACAERMYKAQGKGYDAHRMYEELKEVSGVSPNVPRMVMRSMLITEVIDGELRMKLVCPECERSPGRLCHTHRQWLDSFDRKRVEIGGAESEKQSS